MERGRLVIARKVGQDAVIGEQVIVRVVSIRGNVVRLALEAPKDVRIRRGELVPGREAA